MMLFLLRWHRRSHATLLAFCGVLKVLIEDFEFSLYSSLWKPEGKHAILFIDPYLVLKWVILFNNRDIGNCV